MWWPDQAPLWALQLRSGVDVDGANSWDPDGFIVEYCWDWDDGSNVQCSSSATANHVYAAPGTYDVQLVCKDNNDRHGLVDVVRLDVRLL